MAERRMFAKTIVDSDAFLEMPLSTQALYFHLSMRADDEGFVNNPKKIQRMIGASDDDCKILVAKRFVLTFDSGIIVIKHWKIHNYIQTDRFKPTNYVEEKSKLMLDQKKAYTECIHNGYNLDTQDSIGKVSIGKVSIEKDINNNKINNNNETISSSEIESIFNKMKLEIEEKVPDITFETYFRNLKCRGIKGKRIVLETLPFVRDVIVENHTDLLIETIQKASDGKLIGVAWEN